MASKGTRRRASHAGSWYSADGQELASQLEGWLAAVGAADRAGARAIIAPHAGFAYSGPTAAYAYRQLDPSRIRRVFLLGPSHHVYLPGCAVTAHAVYATPVGDLRVDRDTTKALRDSGAFDVMDESTDEEEHSLEMHLPYLAHLFKGHDVLLVPILVGHLSSARAAEYGQRLAPYLEDPETAFVISSDFCHWGRRFRYTRVAPGHATIHEGIEALDREGMALIEAQDAAAFEAYLKRTENTICGRNPISVLLHALANLKDRGKDIKFLKYAQSSPCKTESDSSVSYASAAVSIS